MLKTLVLPIAGLMLAFCTVGAVVGATAGYVIDKRREKRKQKSKN